MTDSRTSNAVSIDAHMMQARSLLRQAKCPECTRKGMNAEVGLGCTWCRERARVQDFLLQSSAHEPRALPEVGGDVLPTSLADFERACKMHLAEEQAKISPDNALIGTLCNAVRLARENERMAKSGLGLPPEVVDDDHVCGVCEGTQLGTCNCTAQPPAGDRYDRPITVYGTPSADMGIPDRECFTALNLGYHFQAILVVTKMADGSPVPPYAQEFIDWLVAHSGLTKGSEQA